MTSAIDILRSDRTLLSVFLLRHTAEKGSDAFTDEQASRFLLWFAVEGRGQYQGCRFAPDYLAFLAAPVPPYASRLAAYVLAAQPHLRQRFGGNVDLFHAWYYSEGAASLGLLPFVSLAERDYLNEIHPHFAELSPRLARAMYYRYLRAPAARARYDLTQAEHRGGLVATLAGAADPFEPLLTPAAGQDRTDLPGCNIFGFADGVLGIGEDARALAAVLGRAGISRCVCNLALPDHQATSSASGLAALYAEQPLFPVNIYAMTAFETVRLIAQRGESARAGRYSVGYWPWELTSLPADWRFAFDLVDEIWAPSRFLVEVYSRLTDKPVLLMPPYVADVPATAMDLGQFGIEPGCRVFLTMFDFNSYVERKNPQAAIAAFKAAFPDQEGRERMIVKTLNAHAHPEKFANLQECLGDDDRFVLMDGAFSRAEVSALIAAADCFVSLHRAEGFGRVVAEAMLLRTAVVATDWSGTTDFLDETTGYPVACRLRPVEPGEYVFWEGSGWAEPFLESAVAALRRVAAEPEELGDMLDRAQVRIAGAYGLDAVADRVAARLARIARTMK